VGEDNAKIVQIGESAKRLADFLFLLNNISKSELPIRGKGGVKGLAPERAAPRGFSS